VARDALKPAQSSLHWQIYFSKPCGLSAACKAGAADNPVAKVLLVLCCAVWPRDVRFLLVDLRCHGATAARHGFHPPHNMAAAAEDVAELIQQQLGGAAPHLLVGLSLGGKVALQLLKHLVEVQESKQQLQQVEQPVQHLYSTAPAIAPPEDAGQQQQEQSHSQALLQGLPQQVWVLDSQPGCVPLDVDAPTSVGRIIDLIHTIPTPLENRQVLYKLLVPQGIPLSVAQWLGTSLMPGGRLGNGNGGSSGRDQNLDWAFDVQGCAALYNSYRWGGWFAGTTEGTSCSMPALVLACKIRCAVTSSPFCRAMMFELRSATC
jgi:hypothetical protein